MRPSSLHFFPLAPPFLLAAEGIRFLNPTRAAAMISASDSAYLVRIVPSNGDVMIARHWRAAIGGG